MNALPLIALLLGAIPPPEDIPKTKPTNCKDKCALVEKMMADQCKTQKPAFQQACKDNSKQMDDICEQSCKSGGGKPDKDYIKNHFRPKPPNIHDQSLKDQKTPDDGSDQLPPDAKKGSQGSDQQ